MEYISDNIILIDKKELKDNIKSINFRFNKIYRKNNPALQIDFKNNFEYSVRCIKKLIKLKEKNINFSSLYNGKNIKYIISNYNQDVINSLKAIEIKDTKEKYTFIYETFCDELDAIWKKYNPCNFCNQICAAGKTDIRYSAPDGCCARAFDLKYLKGGFLTQDLLYPCPHLGKTDGCTTQNSACKLFACKYIKKNKLIKINPKKFLLYRSFFNRKQKMVLSCNFFKTKEQIIGKLLEKDRSPFFYYSYKLNCLILD